jgi:two-component system, cell cycle sensor histidine kinase and response regulator CckA
MSLGGDPQDERARGREIAATQIAVLDALAAHVALIDSQGVIVAVNEAWRRFARANRLQSEEFGVGKNYLGVSDMAAGMYADEAAQAASGIRAVLSSESESFVLEYPCNWPADPTMWFRLMVTPLQVAGSRGAVIMHVDVSDLRGAQRRLQESEAQNAQLLDSTAEGIYRLDAAGICTYCNRRAALLLGYAGPQQIVGQSAHEHHHRHRPDGTPLTAQECKIHPWAQTEERVHADDEVFSRADGSQFPVEYWSYPILGASGNAGTVVTFVDITQRRSLEAQFLQSQKMEAVGRLAGGVAHDFNNALQVILMYGELLDERLLNDAEGAEHNRQIMLAGLRAAALTRQLLALSRKQILRPELLDLGGATADIEEMLRRTIGEDIELTIRRAANLGAIEADRAQIQQILINLTINARDAMPAGGKLIISSANFTVAPADVPPRDFMKAGQYAMLSVRDTGTGMSQETQERIFEPFFTTKDPSKGTGLGLSTVYGIVKQSKGYILVESELGKGSDFRLFFPVVSGEAQDTPRAKPAHRPLRGTETIFVVEDETPLRLLVGDTLRANGYQVLEAHDGNAAIEFAGLFQGSIDLLLTDVILPGQSGRAVADQIRRLRPQLKVMYMSGYTDDFIADHGVIGPDTILLEKPFPISTLLLKVRETLDGQPSDTANDD